MNYRINKTKKKSRKNFIGFFIMINIKRESNQIFFLIFIISLLMRKLKEIIWTTIHISPFNKDNQIY